MHNNVQKLGCGGTDVILVEVALIVWCIQQETLRQAWFSREIYSSSAVM